MNTSDANATGFSSGEEDFPLCLSEYLKRRQQLDLTQELLPYWLTRGHTNSVRGDAERVTRHEEAAKSSLLLEEKRQN